jgi:hypothetical protein
MGAERASLTRRGAVAIAALLVLGGAITASPSSAADQCARENLVLLDASERHAGISAQLKTAEAHLAELRLSEDHARDLLTAAFVSSGHLDSGSEGALKRATAYVDRAMPGVLQARIDMKVSTARVGDAQRALVNCLAGGSSGIHAVKLSPGECAKLERSIYVRQGGALEESRDAQAAVDGTALELSEMRVREENIRGAQTNVYARTGHTDSALNVEYRESLAEDKRLSAELAALRKASAHSSLFVSSLQKDFRDGGCARGISGATPSAGSSAAWSGSWEADDGCTATTAASGALLTFAYKCTFPSQKDHSSNGQSRCQIKGSSATCSFRDNWHDPDKDLNNRYGHSTMSLAGDTLTVDATEVGESAVWRAAPYASAMHPGATFHVVWKRTK